MGLIPDIHKGAWALIILATLALGTCIYLLSGAYAKIGILDGKIADMEREHALAVNAANEAMKARDEIRSAMQEKAINVERELSLCPDFTGLDIPPDLLRRIKERCASIQSSGGAAYGY